MARVKEFVPDRANSKTHPTLVECGWQVVGTADGPLLQLNTYGSDTRASGKKVSQTIQLDRAAAEELMRILTTTFPGLSR
jgi:hypothetical protein